MAGFTAALTAASIGMQVYGKVKAGQDAKSAADYNAAVYKQQAQVIDIKKDLTSQQYDRAIKQLNGATVVAVAGQNRDLTGSALYVLEDNMTQIHLDKSTELWNLEIDKTRALSSATEYETSGKRARSSAYIDAGSTLLTQGNDWYQKYGGFGQADPIGPRRKDGSF